MAASPQSIDDVAGHIVRSRTLVAFGIGLIFLATFVLPLLVNVARSG